MSELKRYESCIVCGSKECDILLDKEQVAAEARYREQLFHREFPPEMPDYMLEDLVYVTNAYDAQLVVCRECGQVARDPRFTTRGALREYGQDEYPREWLEAAFGEYREAFGRRMPELVRTMGTRVRALEVGSYVGGFLAAAKEAGWQVQGVDVGRCVSEFAQSQGLPVLVGTLQEARFPDRSFHAAFVWVCFDQMVDPWAELKELHRVLEPGGSLWIRVPNGEFVKRTQAKALARRPLRAWILKALVYTGQAAFPYRFGYTPHTLRLMLSRSNFDVVQIRNRTNISDSHTVRDPTRVIPEQARYSSYVQRLSELAYWLTGRRVVGGPWIEVNCRKRVS